MADTVDSSISAPTSNKRRRMLTEWSKNELFANLPLKDVIAFLNRHDLLALAAVNKLARAMVESTMERVYQAILRQQDCDETFSNRVGDRTNLASPAVGNLPFRYLVHKTMRTHLYELAVTGQPGGTSMEMLVLSPLEDRLAIVFMDHWSMENIALVYDLNTKQQLSNSLLRTMGGLFFLTDGKVITYSLSLSGT